MQQTARLGKEPPAGLGKLDIERVDISKDLRDPGLVNSLDRLCRGSDDELGCLLDVGLHVCLDFSDSTDRYIAGGLHFELVKFRVSWSNR